MLCRLVCLGYGFFGSKPKPKKTQNRRFLMVGR